MMYFRFQTYNNIFSSNNVGGSRYITLKSLSKANPMVGLKSYDRIMARFVRTKAKRPTHSLENGFPDGK